MTCKVSEGGEPKCPLALNGAEYTVEVRGASLSDVLLYHQGKTPTYAQSARKGRYKVMIVMSSPNKDSDRAGRPFQGETGEIVAEFAQKAGLDPKEVWCTYLTRCMTPKGRAANAAEYKACVPHLDNEIDIIEPEVLLLLGAKTLKYFKLQSKGGVNSIHGRVWSVALPHDPDRRCTAISSFDPGMFLLEDNHRKEQLAISDFRKAYLFINKLSLPEKYAADYEIVDTLEKVADLADILDSCRIFAWDTESTSLNPRKSPIMCLSFRVIGGDTNYIVPITKHDPDGPLWKFKMAWSRKELRVVWRMLRCPFENPKVDKVAHNHKYDILVVKWWSQLHTGKAINLKGTLHDTQILHHLLDEYPRHDLETLCDVYLGFGNYSEKVSEITGKGRKKVNSYDHVPDDILWPYTAMDVEGCARLFDILMKELEEKPHLVNLYYQECLPMTEVLVDSEWWGHKLDPQVIETLILRYDFEQAVIMGRLKAATWPDFNPLSPPQVAKACQALGFGAAILDTKKSSGVSTDKNVLTTLAEEDPLFADILKYRTNRKMLSTYLHNAKEDLDEDGRIRYSFKQHGTSTGRLACTFFHQILQIEKDLVAKGEATMRDMFIVEEGSRYVYGDFSQVELRILAIHTDDKEMIKIFEDSNADIHLATAAEILGIPEEGTGFVRVGNSTIEASAKDNRTAIGKRVNFGLAYGSEGYALVKTGQWKDVDGKEHNLTWELLESGMERWNARFTGVGNYMKSTGDRVRANAGVCYTPMGRERRMGRKITSSNDQVRKAAEREAINHPIQGAAGSILNRTLIVIHRHIRKYVEDGSIPEGAIRLVNTVHDSMAYEVRKDYVEWFIEVMKGAAAMPVPELQDSTFTMEIGTGDSWTEAEMAAV